MAPRKEPEAPRIPAPSDTEDEPRPASSSPLDRAFLTNDPAAGQMLLIRHGQQLWPSGASPSRQEWVDPPLSETGRRQADALGAALARCRIDAVVCSNLRRARDTAEAVARPHGLEPEVHAELREIEVYRDLPPGTGVGQIVNETFLRGVQERFVRERSWAAFPFTEPSAEFRARVVTLLDGVLAADETAHVAVVCHGGVINAWVGDVLGVEQDMLFRPGHASISRVRTGHGRRVVHTLNEVHHLGQVDPSLVTY